MVQPDDGDPKVGSRRRDRAPVGYVPEDLSDGRGTIPLERSMVLSSGSDSDRSDSE